MMGRLSPVRWLRDMPFVWQVIAVTVAIAMVAVVPRLLPAANAPRPAALPPATSATATVTRSPPTTAVAARHTSTLTPTPSPTPTLMPPEGGVIYALKPYVNRVGWVVEGDDSNHFGDSYLYAGIREGKIYHGAFQFDLSFLPPGTLIHYAAIELTGLDDRYLGKGGEWSLHMLVPAADPEWPLHGFDDIHRARTAHIIAPTLSRDDLQVGQTNVFVLSAGQRAELEKRITYGVVSFRLDGPSSGDDNLFAWDSGYGPQSRGRGPVLRIAVTPPLGTVVADLTRRTGMGAPTPTLVIITPVPTPQNALTAAVVALTATAWATAVGTPTPLPPNWVTPIIVTATPTPANRATAEARAALATAQAILTGTPTPTPINQWVVTPTPTPLFVYLWDLTPAPLPTFTPTALPHVLEGKVAFISNRRGGAMVYIMNQDGRSVALLTDRWAYDFAAERQRPDPAGRGYLSPDGRLILYTVGGEGHRQVWVMNADGSNPHNISNNNFDEHDPIWLRSD